MTLETCSASADLATFDEDLLRALEAFIETRSDTAKQRVVTILSSLVVTAYSAGADRAAGDVDHHEPIGLAGLDPVIDRLGPTLDETFGSLTGELTSVLSSGIRYNRTYDQVRQTLSDRLRSGWGETVTFDRAGQVRRYVEVAPDGSVRWAEKTISRKVTLPIDTYAETLARTNMKAAYARGHLQRYQDSGRDGWVYLSVADERSRPHHLALHGRVFRFGTAEETMALEVMSEPNCRCRPKPWFNDQSLDTDPAVYQQERAEWAQTALNEIPDGEEGGETATYLKQIAED